MAHTTFSDTLIGVINASWLNDTDRVVYTLFGDGTNFTGDLNLPGTLTLNGGGIKFSPMSATLNDYQEGTWAPSVGGTATYTTQTGRFTKVGRQVYIQMTLVINTLGTGSPFAISGLPFAAASSRQFFVGYWQRSAISVVYLVGQTTAGSKTITITGVTGAGTGLTTEPILQDTTEFSCSGVYDV